MNNVMCCHSSYKERKFHRQSGYHWNMNKNEQPPSCPALLRVPRLQPGAPHSRRAWAGEQLHGASSVGNPGFSPAQCPSSCPFPLLSPHLQSLHLPLPLILSQARLVYLTSFAVSLLLPIPHTYTQPAHLRGFWNPVHPSSHLSTLLPWGGREKSPSVSWDSRLGGA